MIVILADIKRRKCVIAIDLVHVALPRRVTLAPVDALCSSHHRTHLLLAYGSALAWITRLVRDVDTYHVNAFKGARLGFIVTFGSLVC